MTHIISSVGLCRHLGRGYFSLTQLTRVACFGLAIDALQRALNGLQFDDAQLARLQRALQEAECPDAIARTWYVERAVYGYEDSFAHMPGAAVVFTCLGASHRVAWTTVAVERFRLAKGHFPGVLGEVVPEFLDAVPLDPISGDPLLYAHDHTCFVVHAVGNDGKPDPDMLSHGPDSNPNDEIVMRVNINKDATSLHTYEARNTPRKRIKHTKTELAAAELVGSHCAGSKDGPDASPTITILHMELGTLDAGIAVLVRSRSSQEPGAVVPIGAAFWVEGGVVYAVNAKAREIAPSIPAAPHEITEMRVQSVVR